MAQESEENFQKGKIELHQTNKACKAIKGELRWKSYHYIEEFQMKM